MAKVLLKHVGKKTSKNYSIITIKKRKNVYRIHKKEAIMKKCIFFILMLCAAMLFSCGRSETPQEYAVTITNRFSRTAVETEVQSVRSMCLTDLGVFVLGSAQIDGEYCQVVSKLDPSGESPMTRLDLPQDVSINDSNSVLK